MEFHQTLQAIDIHKMNVYNGKIRAMGQFYCYCPFLMLHDMRNHHRQRRLYRFTLLSRFSLIMLLYN